MRRSKVDIYLHFVWTTESRHPWLTPELTPPVYGCIASIAERLGCTILAIGGTPNHVHLVVKLPSKTSAAQLVQQAKGASSKLAADLSRGRSPFRWQEGYGVFSLSRPDVSKVIAYVENQARHHGHDKVWVALEEADEDAERGDPAEPVSA